nr:defensin-like protein 17 isoform X2 [Ipomoea batatas]
MATSLISKTIFIALFFCFLLIASFGGTSTAESRRKVGVESAVSRGAIRGAKARKRLTMETVKKRLAIATKNAEKLYIVSILEWCTFIYYIPK